MKQKLFTLFLALVANVGIIYASYAQVDGIWYDFNKSNKTAIVTYRGMACDSYYGEYSGDIVIPSSVTYNGVTYSVTSIGDGAFYDCNELRSITIPNSVTSIGERAFYDCYQLKSITIGNGVTSIGDYAFYYCRLLTSITIPNSVTSIGSIGECAFAHCYSLTSVTIGNSVTSIGERAFDGCSQLKSITIRNGVTSIGDYAFNGCFCLTSVTIPNSVTSIGDYAFSGCSKLTSVTIGNSVTSIGAWAFEGTRLYEYQSNWENGVLYISNYLIKAEENISGAYKIKEGTRLIADSAFAYCYSLTSVTIPNSVTSIGESAFFLCSDLTSVTIGNSVTSIGDGAFEGTRLYEYQSNWENGVLYISNYLIKAEENISGAYKIKEGTRLIANSAFSWCSSLTSVTIPNSVISIGERPFAYCYSLTSITCKATTPPTVGSSAFYGVSKSIPVYVPCGCVEAYKAAYGWKDFTNIQGPLAEYSITVGVNATKMGTAKVDINNACSAQISAKPNIGYHFVQWSDGVVNNPRNIVLTQDTVLIAEFAEIPSYVVEVIYNTDHGTVNGQGTYKEDEEVTLTATANDGYKFHKWSNGVTDNPYTFIVKSDVTLEAKFTSTEGIADVLSSEVHTTKFIRDGQVLILRNGKTYTMQGQEVK